MSRGITAADLVKIPAHMYEYGYRTPEYPMGNKRFRYVMVRSEPGHWFAQVEWRYNAIDGDMNPRWEQNNVFAIGRFQFVRSLMVRRFNAYSNSNVADIAKLDNEGVR